MDPPPAFTAGRNSAQSRVRAETLRRIICMFLETSGDGNSPYSPNPALFTSSTRGGLEVPSAEISPRTRAESESRAEASERSQGMWTNSLISESPAEGALLEMLKTRARECSSAPRKKASPMPEDPPVTKTASYFASSAAAALSGVFIFRLAFKKIFF